MFGLAMEGVKAKRTLRIIKRLRKAYPADKALPAHGKRFKILIMTMLSAQCTDAVAERVTSELFGKYKNAKGLASARLATLERDIRPAGLHKTKAKNIISTSRKILTRFHNRVPDSIRELTQLDGVGRKTANIVLSYGFRKSEGIAVDTHVKRLSLRLGLTENTGADRIERDLLAVIPYRYWLDFNYILVTHGRRVCRARNPLCNECVLKDLCGFTGRRR